MATKAVFNVNLDFTKSQSVALKNLKEKPYSIKKILTKNNVVYEWTISFQEVGDPNKFGLFFFYDDGPLEKLTDVEYSVVLTNKDELKPLKTFVDTDDFGPTGNGFNHVFRYDLLPKNDPFVFYIKLKIPLTAFEYHLEYPRLMSSPPWAVELFDNIENPDQKYDFKLISGQNDTFYGSGCIFVHQSEKFAAMFRSREKDEEEDENIYTYRFPNLTKNALKSILEYLYTGKTTIHDLSIQELINVAYFADDYGITALKKYFNASLWAKMAEEPEISPKVVRYADLLNLKHLKYYGMGIFRESWQSGVMTMDIYNTFGNGVDGQRRLNEFTTFCLRRVEYSGIE